MTNITKDSIQCDFCHTKYVLCFETDSEKEPSHCPFCGHNYSNENHFNEDDDSEDQE